MIITILLWVYQLFIILPFGFVLLTLGNKQDRTAKIRLSAHPLVFLLGLVVLTFISSLLSLVINIGWQVHVFVLVAAVVIWIFLFIGKNIPSLKCQLWTNKSLQRFSLV